MDGNGQYANLRQHMEVRGLTVLILCLTVPTLLEQHS